MAVRAPKVEFVVSADFVITSAQSIVHNDNNDYYYYEELTPTFIFYVFSSEADA